MLALGGCADERTGTVVTPGHAGAPSSPALADPALADPDAAAALDVTLRGRDLRIDWRLGRTVEGVGTRLHLELVETRDGTRDGTDGADRPIDELRPALQGTAARGNARLSVRAHDLAWHAHALRARWTNAAGTTVARSRTVSLAPILNARARRLGPAGADARFGTALAFSTDGAVLVIADPANEALLLHLPGSGTSLGAAERVRVAGLAAALPGTIQMRASAYAAVLVVSWRDTQGASTRVVLETGDDGLHATVSRQRIAAPVRDPALAAGPAGKPVDLVTTPTGAAPLHDGLQQGSLPGTVGMLERSVTRATRARLAPDRLHLAVATLEHPVAMPSASPSTSPSVAPARVTPTLRLFSRSDTARPWQAGPTLRRASTTIDARAILRFGTRPAARSDTLLWHWHRPHGNLDPAGYGLAILTTRAIAQAFGDADRTDRAPGGWRTAFSLPDDGDRDGAGWPVAAALSADGRALAFTRAVPPGSSTSPGPVVLID